MLSLKLEALRYFQRFFVYVLGIGLIFTLTLHSQAAQLLNFEGRAIDPETSALLYIETHKVIINDDGNYLSANVTYSDPYGEVFAEKTLDYVKSSLTPDMMFYDKRSEERITVSLNTGDSKNKAKDAYFHVLIESKHKRKESKVKLDEPLIVVDAGFDRLIESKWQTLKKDNELDFTFLAITRVQLINFEAIQKAVSEASVFVELHPRNFFINILVEPILLEYDSKTKRLLSFEGLTNIERFKDGKRTEENYIARIKYSYQPLKPFSILSLESTKSNDSNRLAPASKKVDSE